MATSGSIKKSINSDIYAQLSWEVESQSKSNNSTTISYKLYVHHNTSEFSSSTKRAYSITINGTKVASGSKSLQGTGGTNVASGTTIIKHTDNGTKTFNLSFSQEIGLGYGTLSGSGSGTLPKIDRSTTPETSASATLGNAITISLPRASSDLTHNLTYSIGSISGTIKNDVATSYSWSLPLSLANGIPNATSGTLTITCKTYDGSTLVGTKTTTLKISVPSSVVPTCSVAISDSNTSISEKFNAFIQSKTKLKVEITAEGVYGSTIKSYKTTIEGVSYSKSSFTSNTLGTSGTLTITTIVTDTRGRTTTITSDIEVLEYHAPAIYKFECNRANSEGVLDNQGTYLSSTFDFAISSCNNLNDSSYSLEYKLKDSEEWATLTSGSLYECVDTFNSSSSILDTEESYDVRLTITDFFSTRSSYFVVSSAFTLMDFNASGKGIAFGKVSERDNTIEFAMKLFSTFGHVISSPVELKEGQDLDELLDEGYYIVSNTTISPTLLNKPLWLGENSSTAFIEVTTAGDGVQRIQTYKHCVKADQIIFQRIYYGDSWGDWQIISGSTSWKELTLESGFKNYSDDSYPRYRVSGNMVNVWGAVSPTTEITGNTTKIVFATGIQSCFRPKLSQVFVCQGSGMNRWTLTIETNGSISVSRYGTSEFINIPTTAWLTFNVTYSI